MRTSFLFASAILSSAVLASSAMPDEMTRAQRIIAKADKELAGEAAKLIAAGKQEDADRVLKLAKALGDYVMPLSKPGDSESLRAKLFAKNLVGNWDRPAFPDRYIFLTDGTAISKHAAGHEVNRGKIRVVTADQAELTWASGHVWTIFPVGSSRLAIDEKQGGDFVNDGIVLFRSR